MEKWGRCRQTARWRRLGIAEISLVLGLEWAIQPRHVAVFEPENDKQSNKRITNTALPIDALGRNSPEVILGFCPHPPGCIL